MSNFKKVIFLVYCFVFSTCLFAENNVLLKMVDSKSINKNEKVIVLSGNNDDADIMLAEIITKNLKENKSITVVDQSEISLINKKYPLNSHLIDFILNENKDKVFTTWMTSESLQNIKKISEKTNARYAIVIWSENIGLNSITINGGSNAATSSNKSVYLSVFARVIDLKTNEVIGYTAYLDSKSIPVVADFFSNEKMMMRLIDSVADDYSEEFSDQIK